MHAALEPKNPFSRLRMSKMIAEFPLFLFTTLGGIAAAAYVAAAVFFVDGTSSRRPLLPLVALALLAVGAVALLLHLGRPERALGAFKNLRAGIAQEGLSVMLFGIAVAIDFATAWFMEKRMKPVVVAAAAAGTLFLFAAGAAYWYLVGVAVWHSLATLPFFVIGSLAVGVPMLALFERDLFGHRAFSASASIAAILAAVCFMAEGVVFMDGGYSAFPFVCATALMFVASVLPSIDRVRKAPWGPALVFAVAAAALVVARYAFYAAATV